MSITAEGFLDTVTIVPGIPDKRYSQINSGKNGIVEHSIVGRERRAEDGVPNRFLDTSTNPDGSYTAYAAASCKFVVRLWPRLNGFLPAEAEIIQMSDIWTSEWTSGGYEINTSTWAIECEGGDNPYDEPLNEYQVRACLRIIREWENWSGRKIEIGKTLRGHGAWAIEMGYAATACPSNRYRTLHDTLNFIGKEPDRMTQELERKVDLLIKGGWGSEDALVTWLQKDNVPMSVAYALEQIDQNKVEEGIESIKNSMGLKEPNLFWAPVQIPGLDQPLEIPFRRSSQ